jgi:hypothetical protein
VSTVDADVNAFAWHKFRASLMLAGTVCRRVISRGVGPSKPCLRHFARKRGSQGDSDRRMAQRSGNGSGPLRLSNTMHYKRRGLAAKVTVKVRAFSRWEPSGGQRVGEGVSCWAKASRLQARIPSGQARQLRKARRVRITGRAFLLRATGKIVLSVRYCSSRPGEQCNSLASSARAHSE